MLWEGRAGVWQGSETFCTRDIFGDIRAWRVFGYVCTKQGIWLRDDGILGGYT